MRLVAIVMAFLTVAAAQSALAKPGDLVNPAKTRPVSWTLTSARGLERCMYFGGCFNPTGEIERYANNGCATPDTVQDAPGGGFTITARLPTAQERARCQMQPGAKYLSGMVDTRKTFSFTYGYLEARLKVSAAPGVWPAFWLLPTTKTPANGGFRPEIDVMETWQGFRHMKSWTQDRTDFPIQTYHPQPAAKPMSCGKLKRVSRADFHTYGVLWEPNKTSFYVDNVEQCEFPAAATDPHYLILNLAVAGPDGAWTPSPTVPPAGYPATMNVAWVKYAPLK